jgi:hypothetical protein
MPEASIDKDHEFILRENEIGIAKDFARLQFPSAYAMPYKHRSQSNLSCPITGRFDSTHIPTSRGVDVISRFRH